LFFTAKTNKEYIKPTQRFAKFNFRVFITITIAQGFNLGDTNRDKLQNRKIPNSNTDAVGIWNFFIEFFQNWNLEFKNIGILSLKISLSYFFE
jgi:hypothetical protein